jgi:hypothetical protein
MPAAPAAVSSFTPSFTAPGPRVPSEWSNIASNLSQTALQYALFNQGNWRKQTQTPETPETISRAVGPGPVMISQGVNTAPSIPPRPAKPAKPIKQEDPLRPPKLPEPWLAGANVDKLPGPWFVDTNFNANRADWDPLYKQQQIEKFTQNLSARLKSQAVAKFKSLQPKRNERFAEKLMTQEKVQQFQKARAIKAFAFNSLRKEQARALDASGETIKQNQESRVQAQVFRAIKEASKKSQQDRAERAEKGLLTTVQGLGFTPGRSSKSNIIEEVIDPNRIVITSPPKQNEVIDPNRIVTTSPPKQNEEKSIEMTPIKKLTGKEDILISAGVFKDSSKPNTPSSNSDVMYFTPASSKAGTPGSNYFTPASNYYTPAGYDLISERYRSPLSVIPELTANTFQMKKMIEFGSPSGVPINTPINETNFPSLSASSSQPLNVNVISSSDITGPTYFNLNNSAQSAQRRNMMDAAALQQELIARTNEIRARQQQAELQSQIDEQNRIKARAAEAQAQVQANKTRQIIRESDAALQSSMYQRRQENPREKRQPVTGPVQLAAGKELATGKKVQDLTASVRSLLNKK